MNPANVQAAVQSVALELSRSYWRGRLFDIHMASVAGDRGEFEAVSAAIEAAALSNASDFQQIAAKSLRAVIDT